MDGNLIIEERISTMHGMRRSNFSDVDGDQNTIKPTVSLRSGKMRAFAEHCWRRYHWSFENHFLANNQSIPSSRLTQIIIDTGIGVVEVAFSLNLDYIYIINYTGFIGLYLFQKNLLQFTFCVKSQSVYLIDAMQYKHCAYARKELLCWVSEYSDIDGNEKADVLAKQEACLDPLDGASRIFCANRHL